MEAVLLLVSFTKNNTPPTSRTENVGLCGKWDLRQYPFSIYISLILKYNQKFITLNQAMKFCQLKYNIRNIFLEKLYTKCDGEANPKPFNKNQN